MSEAITAALIGGLVGSLVAGLFNLLPVILSLRSQERQHSADAQWRFNELFLREELNALKAVRTALVATHENTVLLAAVPFAQATDLYHAQTDYTVRELLRITDIAGAWLTQAAVDAIADFHADYVNLRAIFLRQYKQFQAHPGDPYERTLSTTEGSAAFTKAAQTYTRAMVHTDIALAPTSLQSLRDRPPIDPHYEPISRNPGTPPPSSASAT